MNSVGGVGGKGNKKITESSSTKSNNNNSSNNSSSNETSSNKSAKENTNTNNAVGASSVAAATAPAPATGQSNNSSSSTTANNNNNGKNWETNSATGNSANDALNPLKLTFTTIEHKIRNLEKRKVSFFLSASILWICGRNGGVCVYSCVSVFMWVSVAKKDKREQIAEKKGGKPSTKVKYEEKEFALNWTLEKYSWICRIKVNM